MPMVADVLTHWRCNYCGYQVTNRRRPTEKVKCPACGEGRNTVYTNKKSITDQFDKPPRWDVEGEGRVFDALRASQTL